MKHSDFSFIHGFLYFFGLAPNPSESFREKLIQKSDTQRLMDDWHKIGNDLIKSYETCKKSVR
jgi:hypothetical protein